MKHLTKLALGIIFVMSAACASSQSLFTDTLDNPLRLYKMVSPPAIYEQWWHEIAECENLPLPPEHKNVVWVLVPAAEFKIHGDSLTHYQAVTFTPYVRIYLNDTGIVDRGLVTHEMGHALLFWSFGNRFTGKHPKPYYASCGLVPENQQKT